MTRHSALDKPIISWEDFDRIFDEAFVKPTQRTASPEPIASDTSIEHDSFSGFLSEDEIPLYTPMLFPTLRKESSGESFQSSSKMSQSTTPIPKRPRLMSNQVSSSRRLVSATSGYTSSTGSVSVPKAKRTNSKQR